MQGRKKYKWKAVRRGSGTLHYLFTEHLGSTGVTRRVSDGHKMPQLYKVHKK
jgi:hypothetical protein